MRCYTSREKCIDGITANKEICLNMVKNSIGIVTALNPYIGYKNSTKIAKEALDTVPNNWRLYWLGDLDFDKTIELADKYFGTFQYKELPMKKMVSEEPMTKIVEKTVKSPTTPRLQMAWRTDSYGSNESHLAEITAQILSNSGEADFLDLNVQSASRKHCVQ
ncbi:hypothetical protein FQR65_LT19368 [Abscondita terminalis]|nr:hypothetical protein FQR65_LT19368 [Abscondita terminalis]